MKTKHWLILILIASTAFFFWGRATVKTKEIIRYVKGETVVGNYPTHLLLPIREIKGDLKQVPEIFIIRDTITVNDKIIIVEKADTTAVFNDWMTKKEYQFVAMDNDTVGVLDINANVQFNRLTSFGFHLTPIIKEVTIYHKPKLEPFVSAGINTLNELNVGGGAFYNGIGAEYEYIYNARLRQNGHGFKIKYKF